VTASLAARPYRRYYSPESDGKISGSCGYREVVMKSLRYVAVVVLLTLTAFGQSKIVIPAGSPEDKALTDISQQADQEKRVAMLEDFVKQYASSPAAVAYGNWQLSQHYQTSDPAKAMEYGDRALAAMPDVLDILQTQADLAQQTKNYEKVVDYATRAAAVINNIGKQPKPEGTSDADFQAEVAQEKNTAAPMYEYLSAAAYNAMAAEPDLKKRIAEITRFDEAFPGSKLSDNATVLAVATYQEMNDMPHLIEFGEKALAANPKSATMLTLLANAFAEDPKGTNLSKADTYSRRAIELMKTDTSAPEAARMINEGFAHQILGYTLLREEKTAAAIGELKMASTMLKSDPAKYSITLYRLGFAYAKEKQYAAARQVLTESVAVNGPFQNASRDLLAKVSAAKK
jgi:tetratricopeptide (TPR) repeat protein